MAHRLAPEAESDLDELWHYVASDGSVEIADRGLRVFFGWLFEWTGANTSRSSILGRSSRQGVHSWHPDSSGGGPGQPG